MSVNKSVKRKIAIISVLSAMVLSTFLATYIFAFDNVSKTAFSFTRTYRSITVSWPAATGAKLYAVYSADDALGTNARRIAIVDTPSYTDTLLRPGQTRSYAVQSGTGRDGLDSVDLASLSWSAVQEVPAIGAQVAPGDDPILSPHKGPDYIATSKDGCTRCHITHDATNHTLIVSSGTSDHSNVAIAICADCHEQTNSAEKAFVGSLFSGSGSLSGHRVDSATLNDDKLECITCHGPHQDSAQADNALKPSKIKKFGTLTSDLTVDPLRVNNQCTTCHDDAQTWHTATNTGAYPSAPITARDSGIPAGDIPAGYAGYPVRGTYPGSTTANDTTRNGHAKILASTGYNKGDCRYCHSSHASSAPFDGLLTERGELRAMKGSTPEAIDAERVSGAYASFCLSCHNGSNKGTAWKSAKNIADIVSLPVGSLEASKTAFLASKAGHAITSPNATIPAGSAIPCYTCHDTHGNSAGNAKNISATLATGLTGAKLQRELCLACHTTSDGKILNATATGYVNVGTQKVLGLSRTGMDTPSGGGAAVKNKLKIIEGLAEHASDSTQSCVTCHGSVHNPGITNTEDGKLCIQCHADDFPAAVAYEFTHTGSPEAVGWENGYSPHLIPSFSQSMGMGFFPEKILKLDNDIPTIPLPEINAQKGPYCAGCHAWHSSKVGNIDGSEPGKINGLTLRASYNSPGSASTDYIHTPSPSKLGGLCLSCHNDYLGTKSVGAPTKGPLNPLNELNSEEYHNSAHDYNIPVTRKAASEDEISTINKTFNANCTKCHNSSDAIFQPLANADKLELFGHYTPGRRLLSQYGILADLALPSVNANDDIRIKQDFNRKGMCFGCHSKVGDIRNYGVGNRNPGKQYPGKDWYGVENTRSSFKTEWKNAGGVVIGTQTFNSEAVFDDMYILSGGRAPYAPGDGAGEAADTAAKAALAQGAGMEFSGHQVNRVVDKNRVRSANGAYTLNEYTRANMNSIHCSDCHNVHATDKGTMGVANDWPTTKKKLAGKAGGVATTAYADFVTPPAAIAADGSRLITLNDYYARQEYSAAAKNAIKAWLATPAGGSLSGTALTNKFNEMEFRGITKADLDKTLASPALKSNWEASVDIFCFRCHSEAGMDNRTHQGGGGKSHTKRSLACVHCHLPTAHGGKMESMLSDHGAVPGQLAGVNANTAANSPMQPHQVFRWVDYKMFNGGGDAGQSITAANFNKPTPMLKCIIKPIQTSANRSNCGAASQCHNTRNTAEQSGATWWNWEGLD